MRSLRCVVLVIVIAAGAVGCASRPIAERHAADPTRPQGDVGMREFDPSEVPEIGRLALAAHESFQRPIAHPSNAPPLYPASRLADPTPPREVCVRLAVGEDGRVLSAVDVTGGAGCDTGAPSEPEFVASAVQAAKEWRFDPALRCVFRTASEKAAAANTGCAGAEEIPQAVSLHYRFVFEQKDGRGVVRLAH